MGQDINFAARQAELIADLRTRISDKKVLEAMARVARHLFVPAYNIELAYQDVPLPIGLGQTISQPYIVALMSSALNLTGQEKVLEIGTGSGYQTAILAELSGLVISVERLPEMARQASSLLQSLGYRNIRIHVTKRQLGWKEDAPYDAIIVTAAAPQIPPGLVEQLKSGGRMVIPVGDRYQQELIKVIKSGHEIESIKLGGCRFVSLIGDEAWNEER